MHASLERVWTAPARLLWVPLALLVGAVVVTLPAQAQQVQHGQGGSHGHTAAEIKKDIERHKAMAAAHTAAAQCLESGKKPDQCVRDLQAACKGLAIGKYCGMRHEH